MYMRALHDLLFPFYYCFYMGILTNLIPLQSPNSFCYGIIKNSPDNQNNPSEEEIVRAVHELELDQMPFIFCDLTSEAIVIKELVRDKLYSRRVYISPRGWLPQLPFYEELVMKLNSVKAYYQLKVENGQFTNQGEMWLELANLSNQIKIFFIEAMNLILQGFQTAFLKTQNYNIMDFIKYFLEENIGKGKEILKFHNLLAETQTFTVLYDDYYFHKLGNYSRLMIINKSKYIYIYIYNL